MKRDVILCECFARDGLQHEVEFLATGTKVDLISKFVQAGFPRVEVTSYSNPKIVPQFADASDVLAALQRIDGVTYKATCANPNAVRRAVADFEAGQGATEISLLVSASESHSQRNLKRTREEQWDNIRDMVTAAGGRFQLTGTISVAFGCPFEGRVDMRSVMDDVARFAKLGVSLVMLGDTTGVATPMSVKSMFSAVLAQHPEVKPIAHFHDTRGTGLVNYVAALEAGARHFDCAMGGSAGILPRSNTVAVSPAMCARKTGSTCWSPWD